MMIKAHRENVSVSLVILTFITAFSCAHPGFMEAPEMELFTEEEWIIPDGPVQSLRERTWDLHHQKLRVRFDFEQKQVLGETELLFTSKTRQAELILDAKTMEFDDIYYVMTGESLSFRQDSATVTIALEEEYDSGDTLTVGLQFVSTPPERGLYFVNPVGADPFKPTQVWTLGQPEDNSFWFPTVDHPAERCTQETWISVPPQYTTLSNGLLKESRVLPGDSLRTDYWRMSKPHAPYLFVLAVGEYEVTEEIRGDLLYRYYTEPEFTETVDLIYDQTVDMIRFSEEKTGVSWPWDPVYAQAPVRDFIARGMENTTATLLYDAVQFDRRASQDLSNHDLIMHEIIHHWFGNLVTARDWANLPLNEGFANYFEGIYTRHSEGDDAWHWKNRNNRLSYFDEARVYRRPVIFDRYRIPEDMYDRHTYQKAGQILRMLHDYIGDDNWWDGVNKWLEKFSFKAVDYHDLQGVYEKSSGENLDWFFDQWFLSPGHPYIEISYTLRGSSATVTIAQVQDTTHQPVFHLYPEILFEFEEGSTRERVALTDLEETYHFQFRGTITDVIVDPDRVLLGEYIVDMDLQKLLQRVRHEHVLVRSEAITLLHDFMEEPEVQSVIMEIARSDPFWGVRAQAFGLLVDYANLLDGEDVLKLANDTVYPDEEHYSVRIEAVNLLLNNTMDLHNQSNNIRDHFIAMSNDTSYFVSAESIRAFGQLFPEETVSFIEPFLTMNSYQDVIREAATDALIFAGNHDADELLIQLAGLPGDQDFTYRAIRHLIDSIPERDDDFQESVRTLTIERLDDPYSEYRLLAYEAMVKLGVVEVVDQLHQNKQRIDIGESEREELRKTIRALEYERNYID